MVDQFKVGTRWKDRGLRSKLAFIVALIWSIYTLAYLCKVFFTLFQVVIYPLTHRAISAGLICTLVFLLLPPKKDMPRDRLKWYDLVPILFILAGCSYIAIFADALVTEGRLTAYPFEMVLSSLLFITVLEATRR